MYKLLLPFHTPSFVNTIIWRPHIEKHFEIVSMQENDSLTDYDPKEHIYIQNHAVSAIQEAEDVLNAGFRMILDYNWDHHGKSIYADNVMFLTSHDFILANEILAYRYFGYDKLEFKQQKQKFLLCLMHQIREHRDNLYNILSDYSDSSLISYVERGVRIPGDKDKNYESTYVGAPSWERHVNVDWYTTTNFSMVAETDGWKRDFISEKSFKPFAFRHPLMICGPYKILERIKRIGFATFDNIIDESYDQILHQKPRLKSISRELQRLYNDYLVDCDMFADTETQRRIEHNYNLFYSDSLVDNIIQNQIINPIMEFACQAH